MPEIYSGTGVLKTPELQITKSTGTLMFLCSKKVSSLTNETISIWIERTGSNNVQLAQKISLKEFLYCNLVNQRFQGVGVLMGDNLAIVDFGLEGALKIGDNDKIKIQLEGLIAGDNWAISYVENPVETTGYFEYQRKAIVGANRDQIVDVSACDVAVIKHANAIDTIGIVTSTGAENRYTTKELIAMYLQDNSFIYPTSTATDIFDFSYVFIPLQGIEKLRFYKNADTDVTFTLMSRNELVGTTGGLKANAVTASKTLTLPKFLS